MINVEKTKFLVPDSQFNKIKNVRTYHSHTSLATVCCKIEQNLQCFSYSLCIPTVIIIISGLRPNLVLIG